MAALVSGMMCRDRPQAVALRRLLWHHMLWLHPGRAVHSLCCDALLIIYVCLLMTVTPHMDRCMSAHGQPHTSARLLHCHCITPTADGAAAGHAARWRA